MVCGVVLFLVGFSLGQDPLYDTMSWNFHPVSGSSGSLDDEKEEKDKREQLRINRYVVGHMWIESVWVNYTGKGEDCY